MLVRRRKSSWSHTDGRDVEGCRARGAPQSVDEHSNATPSRRPWEMRAPRPSGRACPSSTSARSCSYIATIDEGMKGGGLISTVFFCAPGRARYCGGGPTGPVRPGSPERVLEHWEDLPHPSVYR